MLRNKIYLITGASVVMLAVAGGAGLYIKNQSDTKAGLLRARQSQSDNTQSQTATQDASGTNIPLNSINPPKASDPNSLKVNSSTNFNANVQGQASPQNQASSSASPSTPAIPGPETFGQYDKYKDDQNALFGDLVSGNGKEVTASSKVAVYYKGWLTNGKLFDQSQVDPKTNQLQPFIFTMGEHNVILGWEQTIFGMKVGGTRRLIIPPKVGYGPNGQGPIPGNAVLVFDVQLLAVE